MLATLKAEIIAGAAVTVVILALSAALWVQHGRLGNAQDALRLQQERADTLAEQLEAARTTSNGWQTVAAELQLDINARVERERVERENAERAITEARARARAADAALASWLDRYAAATRDADCAAQLSRPICAK